MRVTVSSILEFLTCQQSGNESELYLHTRKWNEAAADNTTIDAVELYWNE